MSSVSSSLSLRTRACIISALVLLAGCATLPASGPTAGDIKHGTRSSANTIGFRIVEVNDAVLQQVVARDRAADAAQPVLSELAQIGRADVVGAGDILTIGIYEVGVGLFAGNRAAPEALDFSARSEPFPVVQVAVDGSVTLPYIGRLEVAGHTTGEIQTMIEHALRGKSQNPQALVTIKENISGTIYVAGDVRRSGRFDLSLQRERLLDAIALAGGATYSSEDTVVRFNRGPRTLEVRLGRIRAGEPDDLVLIPGDRIELIRRPRSFIVLGATSKVAQVPFETGDLSLAEAIARAGGPTDGNADPSAVFLFRYGDAADVQSNDKPVIYRLNMMEPSSYFLSQRFAMRDKDVVYIANAAANRPAKLVNIINQLFSPIVTARAISR